MPGGDGGGRAAGGAARARASRSSGLRVGPERAVLGGRAHRELVHVRLADDDRAGLAQPRDDRRLVRAHVALEDARAAGGRQVERRDVVLQRRRARRRAAPASVSARRRDRVRVRLRASRRRSQTKHVQPVRPASTSPRARTPLDGVGGARPARGARAQRRRSRGRRHASAGVFVRREARHEEESVAHRRRERVDASARAESAGRRPTRSGMPRRADADRRACTPSCPPCDSTSMWRGSCSARATSVGDCALGRAPSRASAAMWRTSSIVTATSRHPRSRLAYATTSVLRPIVSSSKSTVTFVSRPTPASSAIVPAAEACGACTRSPMTKTRRVLRRLDARRSRHGVRTRSALARRRVAAAGAIARPTAMRHHAAAGVHDAPSCAP